MASLLKAKTLHVPFKIQALITFISSLLLYLCSYSVPVINFKAKLIYLLKKEKDAKNLSANILQVWKVKALQ